EATYVGETFDLEAFYHVPRYHWKYEGDFYGLVREATDMAGQDIWNSKAPEGVEFRGKGKLDGLKVLFGPEVYWGANPKVVLKYSNSLGRVDWTLMHSEDVARLDESASATAATERQTRATTLYTRTPFGEGVTLELAGLIARTELIDDRYRRLGGARQIIEDEIDFEDTLGVKAKLSFPLFGALAYIATDIGGLVADGGDTLREFGTRLPYSALGNKKEIEAGVMMNFGNVMLFPRVLYRDNLVHANRSRPSSIDDGVLDPGLRPRNRDDDPFAVLDNREARAAELFLTYDPTGETPFYQWDNDMRENAAFAFNIGANYTEYPTFTDSYQFFFEPTGVNAAFGVGLPPEDVWEVSSRMVFNPTPRWRVITNLLAGFQQSTGDPEGGTRRFQEFAGKVVYNRRHIFSGYVKKDAFGPYDFHRQFNVTFPYQYKLDYALLLDQRRDELTSTKVGVRTLFREVDENSPADEFDMGLNDYLFQTVFYFLYNF
ncbi:MAG: hypothetical protein R3282_08595, partial [Rhodothermales bacterium]|nr:hypothetical protein [Rhodothermales bacterium]